MQKPKKINAHHVITDAEFCEKLDMAFLKCLDEQNTDFNFMRVSQYNAKYSTQRNECFEKLREIFIE